MLSSSVVESPGQVVVVVGRKSEQSLTKIRYSFPQTGQLQTCLSHIKSAHAGISPKILM